MKFPARRIVTLGALAAIEASGQYPDLFLDRHEAGDWGEGNKQANDEALISGGRILSVYRTSRGTEIWILTEPDRSATTILLPEEEAVRHENVPDSFWLVLLPNPDSELDEICFESDYEQFASRLNSGLEMERVVGFYGDKETALPIATRLLETARQARDIHRSPWPSIN